MCSIIDAFHFSIPTQTPPSADLVPPTDSQAVAGDLAEEEEETGVEGDKESAAMRCTEAERAHHDIQSALTRRVLPSLRGQLVHDGEVKLLTNTTSPVA